MIFADGAVNDPVTFIGFRGLGWGGVGHVNVMYMLRWWYVVDVVWPWGVGVGWGGVGHLNVMYILRCWYVVDVVWGGACQRHVHLTMMVRCGCGVGWCMST